MKRLLAPCLCALALLGCSDDAPNPAADAAVDVGADAESAGEMGRPGPLELQAVTPDRGAPAGGEVVVISGRGLMTVTAARFGAAEVLDLSVLSDRQLRATTPPGEGTVSVTVEAADGTTATLPGAFTYGAPAPAVGWCNTQFPPSMEIAEGTVSAPIYGRVYVEGCTEGDALCPTVEMELGHGPAGADPRSSPDGWVWGVTEVNPAHVDDDNDEHFATLTAPGPGAYAYTFRARRLDGPWTYCDLGGSADDFSAEETGRLTVTPAPIEGAAVDWCQLQHPAATRVAQGGASEPIYGQVLVTGCTNGAQRCAGVMAQVGHGPADALPDARWTWSPAAYNAAHVEGDNDEYAAQLVLPESGNFAYAYRFRLGDEGAWTQCDADAGDDTLAVAQLGAVEVAPRPIEWCNIQHPETLEGAPGTRVGPIFGRVYSPQCTEAEARCWGLRMQVGAGPADLSPADDPDAFSWVEGAYNVAHSGDENDEFSADLEVAVGQARYAVRFSGDGGQTWTLCDLSGGPFDAADMGTLTLTD